MKILFDTREGTRNITGIGTYVRNLTMEIRAYEAPGVVCKCIPERTGTPPGETIRPLPLQVINLARNVAWKQLYLPATARREKADVLVCMDPLGPLVCSTLTALIIYDLIFLTSGAQTDAWTLYWQVMVPRCARKADLIFTLSQVSKTEIMTRLGVPADKVVVFRTGVADGFRPLERSGPEREMAARKLGLPDSFLLSVGAHDPRRNIKALLVAYQQLKSMGRAAQKLVVVGPRTSYFKEVWETTCSLGLKEDVLYIDYVPNEELVHYYTLADLYVYPSSEEGFGLTPLEAMACGCPVVTSRSSSLPEVVGDAAVMVDPRDPQELASAIDRVLSDGDLKQMLIQKGLNRAKQMSWKDGAEDMVNACVELAEKHSRPLRRASSP